MKEQATATNPFEDPTLQGHTAELRQPPSDASRLLKSPRTKTLALAGSALAAAAAVTAGALMRRRRARQRSLSGRLAAFASSSVGRAVGRVAMGAIVAALGNRLRGALAARRAPSAAPDNQELN